MTTQSLRLRILNKIQITKSALQRLRRGETQQVATLYWEASLGDSTAGRAAKYAIAAHCDPSGFLKNMCGMVATLLCAMVSEYGPGVIDRCSAIMASRLDGVYKI